MFGDDMREDTFKNLGKTTRHKFSYDPDLLEKFENRHIGVDYLIQFDCSEFTSLCPVTAQPDFATIYFSYIPDLTCVESKSLKMYLSSFRNHRDFNEDIVNIIMNDLIELLDPNYIEVSANFLPRGGIAITPYVNYGKKDTKYEKMALIRLELHDIMDIMEVDFKKIEKIKL